MSVFHLKYRPQKIADLDLAQVSVTLLNILGSKNIPQSLLFAGPKGAGKTSAARIFARAINCTDLAGVEPCGKCPNCVEILKGSCMDVIEIDAASNRGIEDARDLKEKAYLLPSRLSKKVFIVDEVHMMTKEAFNALLKLIEEPPVHTYFILCTTDENKIPDTVLSRLVKVDFYKGTDIELKKSLKRVIEGEGVDVESGAIEKIIENSDGSFRNLQKTFNEICLQYGNKISQKDVGVFFAKKFGEYTAEEFESDLVAEDIKKIMEKLEKMAANGADFKGIRENWIGHFQNKMLGLCGISNLGSTKMPLVRLEKWLQLLIAAGKQEKDVSIDQLPLELAVVEFLGDKKISNIEKITVVPEKIEVTQQAVKETVILKPVFESTRMASNVDLGIGVEEIEQNWSKVLSAVKPFNHSVEAFLRSARPKTLRGNLLTVEVFYPFHKDKLDEQKNRKIVENGLLSALGYEISLELVLGKSKRESLVIKNDTPEEMVSENLAESTVKSGEGDMYDVAKEIFG